MTEPELWQLVEQWRKDNHAINHFNVVDALQRKLFERDTGTTTSDHTGTHRDTPGRVDPARCPHCDGTTDIELDGRLLWPTYPSPKD